MSVLPSFVNKYQRWICTQKFHDYRHKHTSIINYNSNYHLRLDCQNKRVKISNGLLSMKKMQIYDALLRWTIYLLRTGQTLIYEITCFEIKTSVHSCCWGAVPGAKRCFNKIWYSCRWKKCIPILRALLCLWKQNLVSSAFFSSLFISSARCGCDWISIN